MAAAQRGYEKDMRKPRHSSAFLVIFFAQRFVRTQFRDVAIELHTLPSVEIFPGEMAWHHW
jgi:hypothetical protein